MPAAAALIQLFYAHVKRALDEEAQTDAILDGKKEEGAEESQPGPAKCKGEEIEETIAKCKSGLGAVKKIYWRDFLIFNLGGNIKLNGLYFSVKESRQPHGAYVYRSLYFNRSWISDNWVEIARSHYSRLFTGR